MTDTLKLSGKKKGVFGSFGYIRDHHYMTWGGLQQE